MEYVQGVFERLYESKLKMKLSIWVEKKRGSDEDGGSWNSDSGLGGGPRRYKSTDDSNSYKRDLITKLWICIRSEDHALIKLNAFRTLFLFCMYSLITGPTETNFQSNVTGFLVAIGFTIMINALINVVFFIWSKRVQITIGILLIFLLLYIFFP